MNHARSTGIAFLLVTTLLVPKLAAQGSFGDRVTVSVVEVPVQVLRGEEPVAGLTAADFEVYDDGTLRALSDFEVVDVGEPRTDLGAASAKETQNARRNLLLLFDLAYTNLRDLGRGLSAARELIASQISPADRVAIATYDHGSGAQLLLGFTADRALLATHLDLLEAVLSADSKRVEEKRAALARSEDMPATSSRAARISRLAQRIGGAGALALDGALPTFTPPVASIAALTDLTNGGLLGVDGDGDRFPESLAGIAASSATELAQQYVDAAVARSVVNSVRAFSQSIGSLMTLLGDVEGQRVLLYLSNGFPNLALTQPALSPVLDDLLATFRRTGWAIHAIDLAGVPPPGAVGSSPGGVGFSANSLLYLAKGTGGAVYENFNRVAVATEKALASTRISYRLTFSRDDLPADGKYHRLDVRVKNERGITVVHRPGYHAPKPPELQSELERRVARAEELLGPAEGGELDLALVAGALPADREGRVALWLELQGASLLDGPALREGAPLLRVEIQAYLLGAENAVADLFVQEITLDRARVEADLKARGLRFYGELVAPPGDYRLRVRLEDLATERSALRSTTVTVPSPADASPALFPPLFPDVHGGWVVARRTDTPEGNAKRPYPVVLGSRDVLPRAAPTFAPRSRNPVLLLLGGGGEHLRFGSHVLREDGTIENRAILTLLDRSRPDANGIATILATLDLGDLPAGRYQLVAEIGDGEPGRKRIAASSFLIQDR